MDIALAIPIRDDKLLITKRSANVDQGGLWEFPGGKVQPGEAPSDAAVRELREETGLNAQKLEPLVLVVHDYAEMPLRFHVFLARDPIGDVQLSGPVAFQWCHITELDERADRPQYAMPPANQQMLRALRWRLRSHLE